MDDHEGAILASRRAGDTWTLREHTLKSFGDALDHLAGGVVVMGQLTLTQVTDAVLAITRSDVTLAQAIVEKDAVLDGCEAEIEREAIRLIALRQPMAKDLRQTVSAMKIAANLERCGDLAKNLAKRTVALADAPASPAMGVPIERLGKLVSERLQDVLDAYARHDVEAAEKVWRADKEVDQLHDSLFRELLTYMMADARMITACAHLLFVAKNLERIGDHATNIAELIIYELTGEDMPDSARPKSDLLAGG
jgi:phosphate transport system protein